MEENTNVVRENKMVQTPKDQQTNQTGKNTMETNENENRTVENLGMQQKQFQKERL